jgi:isoleucyl-tRNA synthetase
VATLCLAPFTPFITERVWQDLFRTTDPDSPISVHLASWPEPDPALADPMLTEQMALVRRLVELGRAARATSSVRTRQPLRRALISAPGWSALAQDLRDQVAEELNVQTLEALADESAGLVDVTVKANFRSLGQRFAKQTPTVASAIAASDAPALVARLRGDGRVDVDVPGMGLVEVTDADVVITETPREGWAVVTEAGESLALDLHIDDELRRAGLAREVVRTLQEGRKAAGLDVSDRITAGWLSDDADLSAAFAEHSAAIAAEVLAVSFEPVAADGDAVGVETDLPVRLWLTRAQA